MTNEGSARFLMAAVVCLLFHVCRGQCPQSQPSPLLEDKVAGSDIVVQGQVVRQVKVRAGEQSSAVELKVQCVFKGGPVPAVISVTKADQTEGSCVQTTLAEGTVNLVYLRRSNGRYIPTFADDPADRKYLLELETVCGLDVQLPSGVSGTSTASCQPDKFGADYYDCPDTTVPSGRPSSPPSAATQTFRFKWIVLCVIFCWLLRYTAGCL